MANPIVIDKISDVEEAVVGQEILYTITVENTTGVILNSAIVSDLLSEDLNFKEGSILVNGIPMPLKSILTGIDLGPMGMGITTIISFLAEIVAKSGDYVSNQSTVVYQYTENMEEKIETMISASAEVLVEIAEIACKKTANKEEASLGDIIIYKVLLTNKGTINALNVVYKDMLPKTLELLADSVTVDDVIVNDPNLEQGINIGEIAIDQTVEIIYKTKVIGGSCNGKIENKGFVEYYYVLPNTVTGQKTSHKCSAVVDVNIVTFKQIMLDKKMTIPCQKPDIEEVDDVTAEIVIEDSYVIETMQGVSNEAQQLSSHKLIVHGKIKLSIEYTALVCDQAMHSAHEEVPFSAFLILPLDYDGQTVDVSYILEDVNAELISNRCVDIGIVFLLIGQIK